MICRMKQRVQVLAGACLLWVVSAGSAAGFAREQVNKAA